MFGTRNLSHFLLKRFNIHMLCYVMLYTGVIVSVHLKNIYSGIINIVMYSNVAYQSYSFQRSLLLVNIFLIYQKYTVFVQLLRPFSTSKGYIL